MNIYVLSLKISSDDDKINYFYSGIFYSLEEALNIGKIELYDFCCNYYDCNDVSKRRLYNVRKRICRNSGGDSS